jgi:ParB family chromosome partitioning protein
MQLQHIALDNLSVSALNMRHGKHTPDIADILPSVRARGVLVPLLVRPNGAPDQYEIVAGRRRYFAAKVVAGERGEFDPLPCAVMEAGDDAAAVEASLLENLARLDPDEMSQYETFVRLTKEGKTVPEIAATFGLTELMVKRRLALGNLLPKIRDAYRREEIDAVTVKHLTMASKAQQKEWLKLFDDPEAHAPRGYQLKQWLFGGQQIATSAALFPLDRYTGQIVCDLFGEETYFADADAFWRLQNAAIAVKRDALLDAGWIAVDVLELAEHFQEWEHVKTPKKKGGKVFIAVSHRGEVEIHEGWLTRKEARRTREPRDAETAEEPTVATTRARPEVTKAMQNYIDLHRHAMVRAALAGQPGVAFRLMVAHAIAGSGLWSVKAEPQQATNEATAKSLAASAAEAAFEAKRQAVRALLGYPDYRRTVVQASPSPEDTAARFARLLALSDEDVLAILAVAMGETLEAGNELVEAVGVHLAVDARATWCAGDAFFEHLRDRAVVNAMLAEVAGETVADANLAERLKTQKQIIRDCIEGANGREKVEGWVPGWLAFPVRTSTEAGTLRTAEAWRRIAHLFRPVG